MTNSAIAQTMTYNGIRISCTAAGVTALNRRFISVEEAISHIDRNFYQ